MNGRWRSDGPDLPTILRKYMRRAKHQARSPRSVLVFTAAIIAVLAATVLISVLRNAEPPAETAAEIPFTPTAVPSDPVTEEGEAATGKDSPSPSKNPDDEKTDDPTQEPDDSGGDGGGDDNAPDSGSNDDGDSNDTEESGTTATRPTKFGAWWASEEHYAAKWEKPADNGGLKITGYVVKKCSGHELARVGAGTFYVDIYHPSLDCVTVQAINAAGEGQTAQFWIE